MKNVKQKPNQNDFGNDYPSLYKFLVGRHGEKGAKKILHCVEDFLLWQQVATSRSPSSLKRFVSAMKACEAIPAVPQLALKSLAA